jgi:[ribosomal protein S18]-alanine N-acetyltransferase
MQTTTPLLAEPMHQRHLEEVIAIEKVSFSSPWSRDMFLGEMSNRVSRQIVFKSGETLVGYLCFWEVLDEAHLMNIAVHPERRGLGYAKYMMEHLEAICLREGIGRIILEVGRRNVAAKNLYRKCGFSSIGFRKNYYPTVPDDALVMEKWLGPRTEEHQP